MVNPIARAERNLAERETSNARDLAVEALVRLEVADDHPLTPEEFGEIMRRLQAAKDYLHSAAVRTRRAYRREQADARKGKAA